MRLPPPVLLAVVLAALAACGSRTTGPPPPPDDETFRNAARAGRMALEMDRPEQAAQLYAAALARARERDDPVAIGEAGFGLATAELARERDREALDKAREVASELTRRGAAPPAALLLVQATALYRTRRADEADRLAAEVTARRAEDRDAAARAHFLRGLIAAERRDTGGLAAARSALGDPDRSAFQADAEELDAHAAMLRGDMRAARRHATAAAAARQTALDYRGLGRALALEAEAAHRMGDLAAAADLYMRAGRGAAARGQVGAARRWLTQARTLAARGTAPDVEAATRNAIAALDGR
jgi:hypothetical protein